MNGPTKKGEKVSRPASGKELVTNTEASSYTNQYTKSKEEDRNSNKQKEFDVLRRMKYIQKQKKGEMEVFLTEVVLPDKETLDFVHRRAMEIENQSLLVKPPDPNRHNLVEICDDIDMVAQDERERLFVTNQKQICDSTCGNGSQNPSF
ncbi:hypothetical protein RIF29_05488 [Crotalaria pallida]|uniref:Uncharacterized protein n=1 Tax=Crotalaria pallida TaxID=3830 RepID=A0AAN9P9S6_CROPI